MKAAENLQIPDWLPPMLKTYGAQRRAVANTAVSIPGTLGRLIAQGFEGAAQGGVASQRWPEVYRGHGLEVWRALQGAPEGVRIMVEAHYTLLPPPRGPSASVKAEAMGLLNAAAYWQALERAHWWLAGRLNPVGEV